MIKYNTLRFLSIGVSILLILYKHVFYNINLNNHNLFYKSINNYVLIH